MNRSALRTHSTFRIDADDALVARCVEGDPAALDALARALDRPVYNLAVRFFWEPADAEDAAQEALVRVVTRLASYRGEAAFSTWCYRVAMNHFLNTRRRGAEHLTLSVGAEHIEAGLARDHDRGTYVGADAALLAEEVRLGCTTAVMVCLSRPLRAAYILGEIVGMTAPEGAAVLEIAPASFRKRLSLARRAVRAFLAPRCGLVDEANPCRCARQVAYDVEIGRIDVQGLRFARLPRTTTEDVEEIAAVVDAAALYRGHPAYTAPPSVARTIRDLLTSLGQRAGRDDLNAAEQHLR